MNQIRNNWVVHWAVHGAVIWPVPPVMYRLVDKDLNTSLRTLMNGAADTVIRQAVENLK